MFDRSATGVGSAQAEKQTRRPNRPPHDRRAQNKVSLRSDRV